MKKQQYSLLLIVFLTISSLSFAQQGSLRNSSNAKYLSSKGYWVIENNIKTPRSNTIYFYNEDNTMVYSEKVEGIKINIKKRKPLLRLKFALEKAVDAWDKGNKIDLKDGLVVTAFKR